MDSGGGSELALQYPTVDTNRAGRWVLVGQGESAYRAFVPHPLPPELELLQMPTLPEAVEN